MIRGGLAALLVFVAACGKNGDQRPTTANLDPVRDAKQERAVTMKLAGTVDSAYTAMLASGPSDLWVAANRQGIEIWRGDRREREVTVAGVITELFVADGQPAVVYAAPHVYEIGAQGFRPGAPTPRQLATGITGLPSGARYVIEHATWSPDGGVLEPPAVDQRYLGTGVEVLMRVLRMDAQRVVRIRAQPVRSRAVGRRKFR